MHIDNFGNACCLEGSRIQIADIGRPAEGILCIASGVICTLNLPCNGKHARAVLGFNLNFRRKQCKCILQLGTIQHLDLFLRCVHFCDLRTHRRRKLLGQNHCAVRIHHHTKALCFHIGCEKMVAVRCQDHCSSINRIIAEGRFSRFPVDRARIAVANDIAALRECIDLRLCDINRHTVDGLFSNIKFKCHIAFKRSPTRDGRTCRTGIDIVHIGNEIIRTLNEHIIAEVQCHGRTGFTGVDLFFDGNHLLRQYLGLCYKCEDCCFSAAAIVHIADGSKRIGNGQNIANFLHIYPFCDLFPVKTFRHIIQAESAALKDDIITVAAAFKLGQCRIPTQIQCCQLIIRAGQIIQRGVLAQIQCCQQIVIAIELRQPDVAAHIQFFQLIVGAVEQGQSGVAAHIQFCQIVVRAGQIFQCRIPAQIQFCQLIAGAVQSFQCCVLAQIQFCQLVVNEGQ